MNVVFLDFDGVVNTPMWQMYKGKLVCRYAWPDDGKVNNWQAVQWLSEFCIRHNYSIVISSTWRSDGIEKCEEYLKAGGLREGIKVIGVTPISKNRRRGDEIHTWLELHPDVTGFIILDDDSDMDPYLDKLVKCNPNVGFLEDEFSRAEMLHAAFNSSNDIKEGLMD